MMANRLAPYSNDLGGVGAAGCESRSMIPDPINRINVGGHIAS